MEFEFKSKKENRLVAWFKKLSKKKKIALIAAIVILVLIAIAAVFVVSKLLKINTTNDFDEDEILINEELDEEIGVGYTNFVLFGADSRDNNVDTDLNTDAIMIISLNNETKEIKMVSIYRDTLLDVKDNNIQKCNSAYRRGGAKQAINMINLNMDMNIQKYVTVNWSVVTDIVDMLGGVEVEVSEAEADAINKYIGETARVTGKDFRLITEPGLQTLDGVQATTYARIRKGVGDDFARTGRQRELIELVLKKAMKADLVTINNIIDTVFPQISTNFTMTEILKYAKDITKYEIGETSGFPFESDSATLGKRGSCTFSLDFVNDVSKLHEFFFGTVDYEPSSKVWSIADEIEYVIRTSKSENTSSEEDTTDEELTTEENTTTEDTSTSEEDTTTEQDTTTTEENTTTEQESTTTEQEATTTEQESTTTEQQQPTTPSQPTTPDKPSNPNPTNPSDANPASNGEE